MKSYIRLGIVSFIIAFAAIVGGAQYTPPAEASFYCYSCWQRCGGGRQVCPSDPGFTVQFSKGPGGGTNYKVINQQDFYGELPIKNCAVYKQNSQWQNLDGGVSACEGTVYPSQGVANMYVEVNWDTPWGSANWSSYGNCLDGNVCTWNGRTFAVPVFDNTPPSLYPNPAIPTTWQSTPLSFYLNCSDTGGPGNTGSNCVSLQYSLGGALNTIYSNTPWTVFGMITAYSRSQFQAYAVDGSGNPVSTALYDLLVDTNPPQIYGVNFLPDSPTTSTYLKSSDGTWYANDTNVKVQFGVYDADSGAGTCTVIVNGTPQLSPCSGMTLTGLVTGDNTINLAASDRVGLQAAEQTFTLHVDEAAPTYAATTLQIAAIDSLSPNNTLDIPFYVPTDTESGVKQVALQVLSGGTPVVLDTTKMSFWGLGQEPYGASFDTSTNTLILKQTNSGAWPSSLLIWGVPRSDASGQKKYTVVMKAVDNVDRQSPDVVSNEVTFDTVPPLLSSLLITDSVVGPVATRTIGAVPTTVIPSLTPTLTFTIDENNNGTSGSTNTPLKLYVFSASDDRLTGQSLVPFGQTVTATYGAYDIADATASVTQGITLESSFTSGDVYLRVADSAGNLSAEQKISFLLDTLAPSITTLAQVNAGTIQPTLKLNLDITDPGTLKNTVDLTYVDRDGNPKTVTITIPDSLISDSGRKISGVLEVSADQLPRFKDGVQNNYLTLTFQDSLGHPVTSSPVSTSVDFYAPEIDTFVPTISGNNLSLSYKLTDASNVTVKLLNNSTTIATHNGPTSQSSQSDGPVDTTSLTQPLRVEFSDGIHTPVIFQIDSNYSTSLDPYDLVSGAFPVTYAFTTGSTFERIDMTISRKDGNVLLYAPVTAAFTDSTKLTDTTKVFVQPPKGDYIVRSNVRYNATTQSTYVSEYTITQDVIAPKVVEETFTNPDGSVVTYDAPSRTYFTQSSTVKYSYRIPSYPENSFPIRVKVNGTLKSTFASIPSAAQSFDIALQNPDALNTVTITFEDNSVPANVTTHTFRIVQDTSGPVSQNGSTPIVSFYKGDPATSTGLTLSRVFTDTYITDSTTMGLKVQAKDSWSIAPKITVKVAGVKVIDAVSMTSSSSTDTTLFEYKNGAISIGANTTTPVEVSVVSIAGSQYTQTYNILHDNAGPTVDIFNFNSSQAVTTNTQVSGTISAHAKTGLTYEVYVDGQKVLSDSPQGTIASGVVSLNTFPFSIILPQGTHDVFVRLIDELGKSQDSAHKSITVDSMVPGITLTLKAGSGSTLAPITIASTATGSLFNQTIALTPDRFSAKTFTLTLSQAVDAGYPTTYSFDDPAISGEETTGTMSGSDIRNIVVNYTTDGEKTWKLTLKDTYDNTRILTLKPIVDTTAPSVISILTRVVLGHVEWNFQVLDTLKTALTQVRVKATNLTTLEAGSFTTLTPQDAATLASGSGVYLYSWAQVPVRTNNTYLLEVETTDALNNTSTGTTLAPFSITDPLDIGNPLAKLITVPTSILNAPGSGMTVTITDNKGFEYIAANIAKTPSIDLRYILETGVIKGTTDKISKLPVGTYDLIIESGGVRVVLPLVISPYYTDAEGDLNGDGFASGLSDEKLYRNAVSTNYYQVSKPLPWTATDQALDTQLKSRAIVIDARLKGSMANSYVEFMKH